MEDGKIFFSYARTDSSDFAIKLSRDLKNSGFPVWIDQIDIPPGQTWDLEIEKALESAKCVICVISERAVNSNNILNEVYYALDNNKTIIPVLLHPCRIPFRLRRLQYIDFTKDYSLAFDRLRDTLSGRGWNTQTSEVTVEPHEATEPQHIPTSRPQIPIELAKRRAELKLITITSIVFLVTSLLAFVGRQVIPVGYLGINRFINLAALLLLIIFSVKYYTKYKMGRKT